MFFLLVQRHNRCNQRILCCHMHQRNRAGIKYSTKYSGKGIKKGNGMTQNPFHLSIPRGPHYIRGKVLAKVKCSLGYKLSWGTVGKGRALIMSKAAPSQGPNKVLILHALLIIQILSIGRGGLIDETAYLKLQTVVSDGVE